MKNILKMARNLTLLHIMTLQLSFIIYIKSGYYNAGKIYSDNGKELHLRNMKLDVKIK